MRSLILGILAGLFCQLIVLVVCAECDVDPIVWVLCSLVAYFVGYLAVQFVDWLLERDAP